MLNHLKLNLYGWFLYAFFDGGMTFHQVCMILIGCISGLSLLKTKPIEQNLFNGFHFDCGFVHFNLHIGVSEHGRFHFSFSVFPFYKHNEVGNSVFGHSNPDAKAPGINGFHFLFNGFHFYKRIELDDPDIWLFSRIKSFRIFRI